MSSYAFTWLTNSALGSWDVNIVTGAMPQKVATAFGEFQENLVGAKYDPIAYLGKQLVNGVCHAVLAQQTLVTKQPVKNIVLIKFLEREMTCDVIGIESVIASGAQFGGFKVDPKVGDDIPAEATSAFKKVTEGWVGTSVTPVALLATKMVKGVDYIFLASVTPVYPGAKASAKLVLVNELTGTIDFDNVL